MIENILLCLLCLSSSQDSIKFGPVNEICAGVNIHFTAGHEKDLDMIAAAGFKYIRMDFIWEKTETTKGVYDWSEYDELTSGLKKRGLSALYILDYSNSLYEDTVIFKDPITGEQHKGIASPRNPESVAAFSRWAGAAASHFRGNHIIWEIWNEPNISFWRPAPDVTQYSRLAIAACKALKAADPDAVVIAPGTSQVPLPFIESVLSSGVLEYLDAVSVHPYRDYSKSPETAIADYQKVRELIDRYTPDGKKSIPVISSEWGYASATKGVSVEKQASYLVRMQLADLLYNIPVSIWYDWKNDGRDPGNFEHNCGTVTYDLKPKPAYTAIQTLNRQLNGFRLLRRIDLKSESDYLLLFKNASGIFKMCGWSANGQHTVSLGEIIPGIKIRDAADWRGNMLQVANEQGKLILNLTEMPQYITLPSGVKID